MTSLKLYEIFGLQKEGIFQLSPKNVCSQGLSEIELALQNASGGFFDC